MAAAVVIVSADGVSPDQTVEALARQTTPHGRVIVLTPEVGLLNVFGQSGDSDPEYVWLLDAGVVPEPDALERLLEAAHGATPAPALLVSRVLQPDGSLDSRSLPVPEVHRPARVLAALEDRAVALRIARRGSMLVALAALRETDLAQLLDSDLEWSARLLRDEPGLLVPASVVVRQPDSPRPPLRPGAMIRTLAAVEPRNRLWLASHFGEQLLAARRARR